MLRPKRYIVSNNGFEIRLVETTETFHGVPLGHTLDELDLVKADDGSLEYLRYKFMISRQRTEDKEGAHEN